MSVLTHLADTLSQLKHLERQKESKKKMKRVGNIELPQEAFYDILRTQRDN